MFAIRAHRPSEKKSHLCELPWRDRKEGRVSLQRRLGVAAVTAHKSRSTLHLGIARGDLSTRQADLIWFPK